MTDDCIPNIKIEPALCRRSQALLRDLRRTELIYTLSAAAFQNLKSVMCRFLQYIFVSFNYISVVSHYYYFFCAKEFLSFVRRNQSTAMSISIANDVHVSIEGPRLTLSSLIMSCTRSPKSMIRTIDRCHRFSQSIGINHASECVSQLLVSTIRRATAVA